MATAPFATVADLEARWRALDEDEAARAEALLADATAIIVSELPRDWKTKEWMQPLLPIVCCSMVQRRMTQTGAMAGLDMPPATQFTQTTGSISQSYTFANPYGSMKMSNDERALLHLDRTRVGTIMPHIGYGEES